MQVSTFIPTTISPSQLIDSDGTCPEQITPNVAPEQIEFYELEIEADETIASNCWYLGVAYLLAGREDDAQKKIRGDR
jgi:hypothetical protein